MSGQEALESSLPSFSLSPRASKRGHYTVNSAFFTSSNVSAFLCLTDNTLIPHHFSPKWLSVSSLISLPQLPFCFFHTGLKLAFMMLLHQGEHQLTGWASMDLKTEARLLSMGCWLLSSPLSFILHRLWAPDCRQRTGVACPALSCLGPLCCLYIQFPPVPELWLYPHTSSYSITSQGSRRISNVSATFSAATLPSVIFLSPWRAIIHWLNEWLYSHQSVDNLRGRNHH